MGCGCGKCHGCLDKLPSGQKPMEGLVRGPGWLGREVQQQGRTRPCSLPGCQGTSSGEFCECVKVGGGNSDPPAWAAFPVPPWLKPAQIPWAWVGFGSRLPPQRCIWLNFSRLWLILQSPEQFHTWQGLGWGCSEAALFLAVAQGGVPGAVQGGGSSSAGLSGWESICVPAMLPRDPLRSHKA